jgi:hypothetical protein
MITKDALCPESEACEGAPKKANERETSVPSTKQCCKIRRKTRLTGLRKRNTENGDPKIQVFEIRRG